MKVLPMDVKFCPCKVVSHIKFEVAVIFSTLISVSVGVGGCKLYTVF